MFILRFALLLLMSIIVSAFVSPEFRSSREGERFVVGIDRSLALDDAARRIEARGLTVDRTLADLHAVELTLPVTGRSAHATALAAIAGVRYVEPVTKVRTADNPSDPIFSRQSAYLSLVSAPQAWDLAQGDPGVTVAVIDTGVSIRHPDLLANIWANPNELANNGFDDDGNGCVDDLNGCAFVSDSSPGCKNITNGFINDDIGHGTMVAGIIAAAGNGDGIVGVARNVRIMPIKVLDCYGFGDSVATARGISYAARNGARVINLSLGGLADAQVVRDAVAEAMRDYGAIVIAASGNSGTTGVAFPARIPEVVAVGAAAPNGVKRAAFSTYGPEVDVVAVGERIIGTMPESRCNQFIACLFEGPYGIGDGTSFSTPQVAGLAALMLSMNRGLTAQRIIDIIKSTATPLADGDAPGWAGSGRINMLAALKAVQADVPAGDPCIIQSVSDGESFNCTNGRRVRMLQMDAPNPGQCGGDWATAALANIFLTPGRTVYLQYDVTRSDEQGRDLASPIWRGNDGLDYNLAIIMVYVGLARAADVGANNFALRDWAFASETWASVAQWNMWAPGKTFNGGCN